MATDPSLDRIQRWMQTLILDQGTCEEAVTSEAAQADISADDARTVVLPSKTLTPFERLDIYREMYLLRMDEALTADYPALKRFVGDDEFARLVAKYVEVYPSRSYTLNRLGDHFPDFIATCDELPKKDFCHDLSRLELSLTTIFDAQETPSLTPEAVAAVPPDAWENARLKLIEPLRLLTFDYPVSRYLGAVDEENPFPRLTRKKNWVVAYRRDYYLHRMTLEEPAYELLAAFGRGETVGSSIESVMIRDWRPAVKESKLFEWFRDWMSEGLFQSVDISPLAQGE